MIVSRNMHINNSDAIICVTNSGKEHVINSYGIPENTDGPFRKLILTNDRVEIEAWEPSKSQIGLAFDSIYQRNNSVSQSNLKSEDTTFMQVSLSRAHNTTTESFGGQAGWGTASLASGAAASYFYKVAIVGAATGAVLGGICTL